MNERIDELVEQAGLNDAYMNFDHKYFAQLIVRECANIAYNTQYNHGRASYETGSCARAIKKHFGVEE